MSYQPPSDPSWQSPQHVPQYQSAGTGKTSGLAITSMVLGIIGVLGAIVVIGGLVGIVALIVGVVAISAIGQDPARLGGKGFAIAGIILGAVSIPISVLGIAILLPSMGRARELSNRSHCAANLRGIAQSMNVYAADNNDAFPVMPPPETAGTYRVFTTAPTATSADAAINGMYGVSVSTASGGSVTRLPTSSAGDVTAPMWLLVLTNMTSPKQYLCKSDPVASVVTPPHVAPAFQTNFTAPGGRPEQTLSYSMAYPWRSDPSVGPWWRALVDSSLPILSDMAPLQGSRAGSTTIDVTSTTPRSPNSRNHGGDGQNVAFSDCHVEFSRTPRVGQNNDNIFTSTGVEHTMLVPPGTPPSAGRLGSPIATPTAPFDVVMVPVRNASSGAVE